MIVDVTNDEALAEIKRLAGVPWRIVWTSHATRRMRDRKAFEQDVINALLTSTTARWQADHQSWAVDGGVDVDGDDLGVRVNIEADLIIRTVY